MNSRQSLVVTAFSLTLLQMADARPGPVLNIVALAESAEGIVAGSIVSVQQAGLTAIDDGSEKVPAQVMLAQLHVHRVLKGSFPGGPVTVRYLLPGQPIGWPTPETNAFRVFFLKKVGKEYEFASPHYPSVVAVPDAIMEGNTPLDHVIGELGAVLQSPSSSIGMKRQAIWALSTAKDASATEALRKALLEHEQDVRLTAITALVSRGDGRSFGDAVEILLQPPVGASVGTVHNLAYAVGNWTPSSDWVLKLAKMYGSEDAVIRRAAISALAKVRSSDSIPLLARALDDANREVRYAAIMGLADITGEHEWKPDRGEFQRDEMRYLVHWKDWRERR